ncbi:hypothetical protein O6H91_06G036100 [Diphasiastrum complanatum]|uniref:Uncharacterized protein n=2 Tax=Diphasiastrum complanatum TaxID=34168 RepID=A0ACC2DCL3_DIPCM|nr:hypothetical protein O6H91_06G036100 [Diphasiastrum complanatum]KAJ7551958.1 hypothetical protein O6H91_06G036100 [Diphasiastrum complanatum]
MRTSMISPFKEVMVLKAKVLPYLTCPICNGIFRDATTISECLHTFCERCITKKLIQDDSCPICEVPLGCTPLEKLRTDHQLSEVKKLLLSSKKNPPGKRKEKFLSSLISPPHPPVIARQITKFQSAKRSTSSNGFQKTLQREARPVRKALDRKGLLQRNNFRGVSIPNEYSKFGGRCTSGEKRISALCDSSKKGACIEDSNVELEEPSASDAVLDICHASKPPQRRLLRKSRRVASQPLKEFRHIVEDFCRISVTASTDASSSEDFRGVDSVAACLERLEPTAKSRCRDTAVRILQPSTVKRNQRQINNNLEKVLLQVPNKRSSCEVPNAAQKRRKNLKTESLTTSTSTSCDISNMAEDGSDLNNLATSIPEQRGNGFWFRLQAAKNQDMDGALPQISTQYIRIWDGRQPVSAMKKYLAKKLSLKSEKEVEITCQGQPVVPGLPLESVKNIWLATALDRSVPEKETSNADSCSTGSGVVGNCLEDELLVVLTYARKLLDQNLSASLILHT